MFSSLRGRPELRLRRFGIFLAALLNLSCRLKIMRQKTFLVLNALILTDLNNEFNFVRGGAHKWKLIKPSAIFGGLI